MTTVVVASSYLSASLLTMLVPIATVVAVLAWLVVQVRRHERRREDGEAGHASAPVAGTGGESRAVPGER
jgi:heme/copper-type cytochrome/quinol oxidase subunit 2